jgi:Zn-dependent alcohol dehydrogenase
MGEGGLLDGTTRLSRDGEPVYHYSFISSFAEATVLPERSCVRIPRDVPFEVAGLVGCAVTTGVGAVWRTAGVRPGDRVAVVGCGGVGLSAVLAAAAVGAGTILAVDVSEQKLADAAGFGATGGVLWAGSPEATADAVREASGGRDADGVSLDACARCSRADRDPARGRRPLAARALDPAHGAPGARFPLRFVPTGT